MKQRHHRRLVQDRLSRGLARARLRARAFKALDEFYSRGWSQLLDVRMPSWYLLAQRDDTIPSWSLVLPCDGLIAASGAQVAATGPRQ